MSDRALSSQDTTIQDLAKDQEPSLLIIHLLVRRNRSMYSAWSWPADSPAGIHNLSTRLKQQEHLIASCILVVVILCTEQAFDIVTTHRAQSETFSRDFLLSWLAHANESHWSDKAGEYQHCDPRTLFPPHFFVGLHLYTVGGLALGPQRARHSPAALSW